MVPMLIMFLGILSRNPYVHFFITVAMINAPSYDAEVYM